jgi:uncharacterized coiled-coil DUF342 family protein
MSTETHNGQAEHDTPEHDAVTPDATAQHNRLAAVVREAEDERATLVAQRDQINAQIKALQKQKAKVGAEVERCDSLITWATKTVKPRGQRSAAPPAPKKR